LSLEMREEFLNVVVDGGKLNMSKGSGWSFTGPQIFLQLIFF